MSTSSAEEFPDQRVLIYVRAGTSIDQEISQTIEEADTFRGAARACEVVSGAVCERRVVGLCAGIGEAADWLII